MSYPVINQNKIGTCPHGLPMGACPICNGMSGGGSSTKMNSARKPGEMTWSQCFAQGMLMKQTEARLEAKQLNPLYNAQALERLQQNITNYVNNVQQSIKVLQNSLPQSLANVVNIFNNIIITPFLNILQQIPKIMQSIQNGIQNLREMISQATEKLTAFFGEVKNFVKKKVSDFLKVTTKKIFKLFSLSIEDEDETTHSSEIKDSLTSNTNNSN